MPTKKPSVRSDAIAVQTASDDDWQATEQDWTLLARTPAVRVWKLVALTFGIRPTEGIRKHLPAEVRVRYEELRSIARGAISLDRKKPGRASTLLRCQPPTALAAKEDHNRATLDDYLDFLDRTQTDAHPRMVQVALTAKHQSKRSEPKDVEKQDNRQRIEDITRKTETLARVLVPVLILRHGLEVKFVDEFSNEFDITASHGLFANWRGAVAELGMPEVGAATPKEAMKTAISILGPHEVRAAIEAYRKARGKP